MRRMSRDLAVVVLVLLAASASADIRLEADGHFAEPGFALLVYHNRYIVGRAGGVQAILHGGRSVLRASQAGYPARAVQTGRAGEMRRG
jgi:hypothetical protein